MNLKYFKYFLAASFFAATLHAGIEQYFKKVEGKSDIHKMKNIDFIYTINLDKRPEKFAVCTDQLHPYDIYPYRFSAVNGWELTLEEINDLGVTFTGDKNMIGGMWGTYYPLDGSGPRHEPVHRAGRTYFCHCMSRGAIGINLSHLSILQDAYDSGYETIWVMEDDIHVVKDPHILSELIDRLDAVAGKKNWDMLFTDPDTKDNNGNYVPCLGYALTPNFHPVDPKIFSSRRDVSTHFRKIGARYGAYSMIIRRSGMQKILDFVKTYKIFLPFDMVFYLPPGMNIYSVKEDYISTIPNSPSDNGGPNYNAK